ncbi:O-antigen ligase family protein [Paracrocinitomix mangrovi]|uniref:O-antigen ligase family protein n=1 Tax=Paracrocinitomix mangrovi TaxID=2862509 RepID=UPI001EDC8618|nr:O-antigen ligase family protein [Paracrocinitomix mangrovi]UKN03869.1 O-antigen ligase family protein [Paracrocinitomix mangrovi]
MFAIFIYVEAGDIQNYSTLPKWICLAALLITPLLLLKNEYQVNPILQITVLVLLLFIGLNSLRSNNPWDGVLVLIPPLLSIVSTTIILQLELLKSGWQIIAIILIVLLTPLVVYTLYDILNDIIQGVYSHKSTYQYRYSFGHRNQFAQFLTISIPFIISLWSKSYWKNIFTGIIVLLFLALILLLQNRTAYLIAFGIYPMLLFIFWTLKVKNKKLKITLLLLPFLAISSFFIVAKSGNNKISYLLETNYGSGNERLRIWKNSIDIWQESPIIGQGTADWKIQILNSPLRFTQAEQSEVYYQRAHNEFVHILTEQGVVGLILLLFIFGFILLKIIKWKQDVFFKFVSLSIFFCFSAIAFFSFPFERIELTTLFILGIIPAISIKRLKAVGNVYLWILKSTWFILLILVAWISIYRYQNEQHLIKYQLNGKITEIEKINTDFYTIDATSTPISWYKGNYYYGAQNFEMALQLYLDAEKRNPYHVHVLNNIGSTYYIMGEMEQAETYFDKAIKINPLFSDALINKAAVLYNKGEIDPALLEILKVLPEWEPPHYKSILIPILKAKCYWLMELHDDPPFEAFLESALQSEELLYQISIMARKSSRSYEDELRKYCADVYLAG